jgi:hypothetical protein
LDIANNLCWGNFNRLVEEALNQLVINDYAKLAKFICELYALDHSLADKFLFSEFMFQSIGKLIQTKIDFLKFHELLSSGDAGLGEKFSNCYTWCGNELNGSVGNTKNIDYDPLVKDGLPAINLKDTQQYHINGADAMALALNVYKSAGLLTNTLVIGQKKNRPVFTKNHHVKRYYAKDEHTLGRFFELLIEAHNNGAIPAAGARILVACDYNSAHGMLFDIEIIGDNISILCLDSFPSSCSTDRLLSPNIRKMLSKNFKDPYVFDNRIQLQKDGKSCYTFVFYFTKVLNRLPNAHKILAELNDKKIIEMKNGKINEINLERLEQYSSYFTDIFKITQNFSIIDKDDEFVAAIKQKMDMKKVGSKIHNRIINNKYEKYGKRIMGKSDAKVRMPLDHRKDFERFLQKCGIVRNCLSTLLYYKNKQNPKHNRLPEYIKDACKKMLEVCRNETAMKDQQTVNLLAKVVETMRSCNIKDSEKNIDELEERFIKFRCEEPTNVSGSTITCNL